MTANQLLQRARWGFGISASVGMLVLVLGVPMMDADAVREKDYWAWRHSTDPAVQELRRKLDEIAGPGPPSSPPEPIAPSVFRTGWHLLLLGLVGCGVVDCAAAIVVQLQAGRQDDDPPAEPAEPAEDSPRKPPVLR